MRTHATPVAETSPAAVLRRACDCHATAEADEICPACAAKAAGVQPRLVIGPVDDPFEREAEAMAEAVVAGRPGPAVTAKPAPQLQPKASAAPHQGAAPAAAGAVSRGGRPLSQGERAFFEPRFGQDLGHVRLHDDAGAGQAARAIGARAYTLQNHIAFAPGQFAPGTSEGRRLIAHELTHTLQQSGPVLRRLPIDLVAMDQPYEGSVDQPLGSLGSKRGDEMPSRSVMTYAEARALMDCIKVVGSDDIARAECAESVLGVPVPEWKTVPGISSPVPFRAGVATTGEATTRIGPVNLTVLPDTTSTDAAMTNAAKTEINVAPLPAGTNFVDWVSNGGTVSSFTFNQDVFAMTIQTTFGPGASAGAPSGYGRGTSEADKDTRQTTLGFHEGEHGRDFITYLQANPYPVFAGKTGQSDQVFRGHVVAFKTAVAAYIVTMSRLSELRTDCAGKSIDTSNAEKGRVTSMCVRKAGDPVP
jgi:hypothetical protein